MKKLALLFPGQGSQYVKMGKALYDESSAARLVFEEADDSLGFSIKNLCFNGDLNELTKTENAQPAILTVSVAAFRVFMEQIAIKPVCGAGHSLGEYSALTCSGAIKFSDAVRIVRHRGKLMQEAASDGVGAMAAVSGVERAVIEAECKRAYTEKSIVVVSNYNSPNQTVISGLKECVEAVGQKLIASGATVTPLKVSAPFHCPLMQPAADSLKEELLKYKYSNLNFPVISNVTAFPYDSSEKIVKTLIKQMVAPVQWVDSMQYLAGIGIDTVVELGPQTVLRNLMKRNIPSIKAYSYDKSDDAAELLSVVDNSKRSNTNINRTAFITKCMAVAICTRNRNWNNYEYEKGVSEPYKKIQRMYEEIESSEKAPTSEQMNEALEMLISVFITKQTPVEEQAERFNHIFEETNTRYLFPDFKMPV